MNTKHPLYNTWRNMRQRCQNPNSPDYKNYGARGIWVHPSWNNFEQFCEDLGERPKETSLDRLNNNGPYSKENCHWATKQQQNRNSRQCKLTEDLVQQIRLEPRKGPGGRGGTGSGLTLKQLASKYNVSYRTIRSVLDNEKWHMRVVNS